MSTSLCREIAFDHPIMESKSNFLNGKTQNRSDSFSSGEFSFPLFDGNQNRFPSNLLHASANKPPPSTIDFYSAISLAQKSPSGFPQEAPAIAPPHNASEVETPGRTSNDPSSNQSEFSNICNLLTMLASSLSPQQRQKLVEKLVQEANASCPTSKEPNSSFQPWNPNGKLSTPASTEESDRGIKNSFSLESTSNKSLSSIELCFSDPAKFFFGPGMGGSETNRTDAKHQSSLESLSSSARFHPAENHPTLSKSDISFLSSRMKETGRSSGPVYNHVNGQQPNPMLKDFLPRFGQAEGHVSQERNSWWNNASRIEEAVQMVNGDKDALLSIQVSKKSDRFSDLIAAAVVEAKKDEGDVSSPTINISKRNKWEALMDVDLPTPNPAVRKSPREIFDISFDTGDVPPLLKTSKSINESYWESILKSPKDLLISPGKLLSPGSIFFSPRNGDKSRGFGFGSDGDAFKLQASRFAPISSNEPAKALFPLPQGSSSESNAGNRAGVDPTCDQKSNASDLTFDKCMVDSRLTSQMSIEETSMAVEDKNLLSMNSEPNRRDLFGLGIQEAMNMVKNSVSKRKTMESDGDIQSQGFQAAHPNVEDGNNFCNGMSVEGRENGNDTSAAIAIFSSLSDTNKLENLPSKNYKKAKVLEEESNDKFNLVSRRRELAQNPQAHAARKRRFDVNQRIKTLLDLFPSIRQGDTATMLHEVIENVNKIVGKIKSYTLVEKFEKTSESDSPHSSFPEMSNSNSFTKLLESSTDPESSKPGAYPGVDLIAENLTSNGNLSKRAMHAAKYRLRKKLKEAERMNKCVKKGPENHVRKEAADVPSIHSESTKRVQSLYAMGLCLVPRDLVFRCLETPMRE